MEIQINSTSEKYSLYVNKLIAKINDFINGTTECPPWVRPWKTLGPFRNIETGSIYHGTNIVSLSLTNFQDPRWITFNGVRKLKGKVKKGEKATTIFYYNKTEIIKDDEVKKYQYLISSSVFNVEQCELEIEPLLTKIISDEERNLNVESLLKKYSTQVIHNGTKAFYSPAHDEICLPLEGLFKSMDDYYATFLHELIHFTGHKDRRNRNIHNSFGSKLYAFEELIAEIGSALLCYELGVNGKVQHPEYIREWLKILNDDEKQVSLAASEAIQACNYILNSPNSIPVDSDFTTITS